MCSSRKIATSMSLFIEYVLRNMEKVRMCVGRKHDEYLRTLKKHFNTLAGTCSTSTCSTS